MAKTAKFAALILAAAAACSAVLAEDAPAPLKTPTTPEERHACVVRVQEVIDKLKQDVDRHGPQSHQAQKRRQELRKVLNVCGPTDPIQGKKKGGDDDDD
jgi:hypothetical protein